MPIEEIVSDNDMSTVELVALHYVECYALMFPDSGAKECAKDLREKLGLPVPIELS